MCMFAVRGPNRQVILHYVCLLLIFAFVGVSYS